MQDLNHQETGTPAVALVTSSLDQERTCHLAVAVQTLDEQGRLIEAVIRLAFDTLGARRLVLRVYQAEA
jgi:hypothetical protein